MDMQIINTSTLLYLMYVIIIVFVFLLELRAHCAYLLYYAREVTICQHFTHICVYSLNIHVYLLIGEYYAP